MTPKPANHELRQRPVWDPKPGTENVWACLTSSLAMHRLSDRVLGALAIAIDEGLISRSQCNPNESDLKAGFEIRKVRSNVSLGRGLLTPDRRVVVAISVTRGGWKNFALRGTHPANEDLPVIPYNEEIFQATYPNFVEWRNQLIYKWTDDGNKTPVIVPFKESPKDDAAAVPADWRAGLTRDRNLASERSYRVRKLNPETGKPISDRTTRRAAASAIVPSPSPAAPAAAAPPIVANSPVPKNESALEGADRELRDLPPAVARHVRRVSATLLHRAEDPVNHESSANQPQSASDSIHHNQISPRDDLIAIATDVLRRLSRDEIRAALHSIQWFDTDSASAEASVSGA